jgi:uncharacterized protein YxeA
MKLSWKTILIGVGILLVLIYGAWYGWKEYRFLKEQASIKQGQEEIRTKLENENNALKYERDQIKKERDQLNTNYRQLEDRYAQLESQAQNISVPADPSALADGFRKHGYRSAVILNQPR